MSLSLKNLDTPSLVVDLDIMERNIARLKAFIASSPMELRPHTKAHKIPELAKLQVEHGAQGICVGKLGEAEVMVEGGLEDVLITTPIANSLKISRLVELTKKHPKSRIIQVVDDKRHVELISEAARAAGVVVPLLIEIESGQNRCGILPGAELIALVELINSTEGVKYLGLQAYTGHLQHVREYSERNKLARELVQPLFDFIAREMTSAELKPEIISGGGTGTYDSYEGLPFTELQAGSYLFMDWNYHNVGSRDGSNTYKDFDCALKVWTTVISRPTVERAVVDAGMKSLSIDSGMPQVEAIEGATYASGGDEHGIITLPGGAELELGERLMMIPSHCDTTLAQYSTLYGIRGDVVEKEWEILGRGRSD